ncbi:MAG: hypothetical protein HRU19_27725 [Pseudobacteriovorax sp.]|nr:hypothetical protein [Pseudobacteriovorax sp.]
MPEKTFLLNLARFNSEKVSLGRLTIVVEQSHWFAYLLSILDLTFTIASCTCGRLSSCELNNVEIGSELDGLRIREHGRFERSILINNEHRDVLVTYGELVEKSMQNLFLTMNYCIEEKNIIRQTFKFYSNKDKFSNVYILDESNQDRVSVVFDEDTTSGIILYDREQQEFKFHLEGGGSTLRHS